MNRLILSVGVFIALTGCTTVSVDEGANRARYVDHQMVAIQLNNVELIDDSIANKVEVQKSGATRTPTNSVQVFAQFRNRTDFTIQIECRATFYDAQEVVLEAPSAWQRLILEPNSIGNYRESSLNAKAAFYHVEVREGR